MLTNPWEQPLDAVPTMDGPPDASGAKNKFDKYPGMDLTPRLFSATRRLLVDRSRKLTYERITLDTGLKAAWLSGVNSGKKENYAISMVERLYHYLKYMQQHPELI